MIRRIFGGWLGGFLAAALWAGTAQAQTNFWWTNNAGGVWSASSSWTNGVPGAGGSNDYSLIFQNTSAVITTNDRATPGFVLNKLQFSGANTVTIFGGAGTNLVFTNSTGGVLPQIVQNTASTITLNIGLNLATNTTFGGTGAGLVTVNSNVTGVGGLIMSGANYTLLLSGSNTYSGATLVSAGVLKISTNYAIPGDVAISPGGTFDLNGQNLSNKSSFTIGGTGAVNQASTLANSSATEALIKNLTLTTNATIGVANKVSIGGTVNGGGYVLTIGGASTVDIRADNALTNLAGININSGTLRLESSQSYTGSVTVAAAGTLDSYGNRTNTVAVTLNGGTLANGGSGNGVWTGAITLNNTATFNDGGQQITLRGPIGGTAGFTKTGAGTVTLSGTNNYAGGTTLNAGNFVFANLNAVSSNSLITINANGALNVTGAYATVQGWLDSGRLDTTSSGTVALGVNSSEVINFTTLGGGNYTNLFLGASSGNIFYSGTNTPNAGSYRLGGGTGTLILTNDLALTGPNGLVVGGALGGTVILNGSNSFTGGTILTTNTLSLASENNIGGLGAALTITGGTLQIRGTALHNFNNFTGNITNIAGSFGLDINNNDNIFTMASNTTVTGSFTKFGNGTLVLSGSNTIGGGITVSAGVLSLQNARALGNSSGVIVNSGATLQLTNGLTYAAVSVTLNGVGFNNSGALRSVSDGNTYLGTITNTAGSRINSDVGTLTLSNVVLSAAGSYFGGAGNIRVVGNLSGGLDVYKDGPGTLTFLTATTDNTRWWTVYAGTLVEDFSASSAPVSNIFTTGKGIQLSGGTLLLIGKAGLTNSQSYGGGNINFLAGNSAIVVSNGAGGGVVLTCAGLNRTVGAMIDFTVPTAPGKITTTAATNSAGLLGGWATVAGTDWATETGASPFTITNFSNYSVVSAGGSIASNPTTNVKFDSTSSGSLGLGAPATIINSLVSSSANAITITNNGNTLRLGAAANGGILLPSTSGGLTIGATLNDGYLSAGGSTNNTAGEVILINNSANDLTINSAITNNGSGAVSLTVANGSVTFNGNNNYTGATYMNAGAVSFTGTNSLAAVNHRGGTLTFAGGSSNSLGAVTVVGGAAGARLNINGVTTLGTNNLVVANATGSRAVVAIITNLTAGPLQAGVTDGANNAGAVYQYGGTFTNSGVTLGSGTGDYGYYRLTNGTMVINNASSQLGVKGYGVFEMTGGTLVRLTGGSTFIGGTGAGGGAVGMLNIFGGTYSSSSGANYDVMGGTANGGTYGLLNVGGSGVFNPAYGAVNKVFDVMYQAGNTNVVNLLTGGTIIANQIKASNASGPSIFNFNGGTLTTSNTSTLGATFLQGLTAAYVYQGGAIINTTNINLTIAQSLRGPTGYGLSNIQLASQGAGYLGTPVVVITGGQGLGATALAQVDYATNSPTYGQVTNILVTSTGSGYLPNDAVTVQLLGGGFTNSAVLGAINFAANNSTGGLTKLGTGTLILTGTNTYTGDTVVNNGTLQLGAGGTAGSVASANIAVGNGAWIAFNRSDLWTNTVAITGAGGVVQNGPGTLVFASVNNYAGMTWLNGGTLSVDTISDNGPSQIGTNNLLGFNGGTLRYTGPSVATSRNVTNAGTATFNIANSVATLTVNGNITGGGALNKTGPGTLTLTATNTYSGATMIGAGTLTVGGAGVLGGGNYSAAIINTGLFVYASSADQTLNGNISGTGALIKANSSTLTLYGNNTHSGGTTISQGTLQVVRPIDSAVNPLGTGLVTLDGGTLNVAGQMVVLSSTQQTMSLTGWNRDFIWANSEPTTTNGTDYVLNNWVYYEKSAARNGGINGMPTNRIVTSALNSAITFQLEPYNGPNTLLTTASASTLTLATPGKFLSLNLLDASGNAVPTITYTLNFADGSTTTGTFQPRDWVGPNAITTSLAAQSTSGGSYYANAGLNQTDLYLSTLDQNKVLNSITFQVTANGSGGSWIMGVSGAAGTTTFGATQSYGNGVKVTLDSMVDVRNSLTASFGPLSIGSRTLSITGDSGASVTFGATTLSGSPTFNTATNITLNLGAVGDGGTGRGITKTGPGTLTLKGPSTYTGGTIISQGTLRLDGTTTLLGNIMPTGDSITYGSSGTNAGYRSYLYSLLTAGGYSFQFVGSQNNNPGTLPTTPVDQTHHEGHSGWTVAQVLNGVTPASQGGLGWLNVNPDIITLMIGTNNRGGGTNGVPGAISQLGQIIDTVALNTPGARLFVGEITPIPGQEAFVNAYNSNVITLVSAKQAVGDNIFLVDLNTYFPTNGMSGDNLHPNDTGYSFMAQQWYSTIVADLGNVGGSVLSPSTTVAIAMGATLDLNGVNQTLVALSDSAGGGGALTNSAGTTPLTLTINPSFGSTTFSGTISDTGVSNAISLVKSGAGTQVLSGTNTYTGSTTINAGTLAVGASNVLSTAALVMNGGALGVANGGGWTETNTINLLAPNSTMDTTGGTLTLSGAITNSGALTKTGGGTLTLSGQNTYSGATTLSAGELSISSYTNIALGNAINFSGGLLQITGTSITDLNPYIVNNASFNGGFDIADAGYVVTLTNNFSGPGSLTKLGAGTLTLAAANSYSGATVISNGTLKVANTVGALSSSTTVYVDSMGLMDFGGNNQTIAGLTGGGVVTNGGGNLTINLVNTTNAFSGVLQGASALLLTGGGTLNLAGTNNFAGALGTIVSNATYNVNGLHNGALITAYSNSTVGGTGPISGTLLVNGGTYQPGYGGMLTQMVAMLTLTNSGTLGVALAQANNPAYVTVSSQLTLVGTNNYLRLSNLDSTSYTSGKIYLVDYHSAGGFDYTNNYFRLADNFGSVIGPNDGWVLTNNMLFSVVGGGSATNIFTINYDDLANGVITLTAVPEPGTASLLGLVGVAFLVRRLRRRTQS